MFARTPRLTLRPAWPEDAPALARAIGHRSVAGNLSNVPWPYDEGHARDFIAGRAASDVVCLILAHEAPTPHLVGCIGLHPIDADWELGYWLSPDAWGRGYATEAGRAMTGIARHALGLRRIDSSHFVDNPASGRVLRKLGFRPTGTSRMMRCPARDAMVESTGYSLDLAACDDPAPVLRAA